MNRIAAHITETSIIIVERNDANLVCRTVATEARPASLADADTMLAFHSMARTAAWDLGEAGSLTAPVQDISRENVFNGTVAARLDQAVGTTHDEIELTSASKIENGDIITDADRCVLYVVAGSSWESDAMTVHMVAEGKTWNDRYTSRFGGLVHVARKR